MTTEPEKSFQPRRHLMKYVFLALVILFLLWVFIPRPLSYEVKQQLTTMEKLHATPSKAFVYLIGMDAPDDIDPLVYGQKLLPQYIASAKMSINKENQSIGVMKPEKNIKNYSQIFDKKSFACSISNEPDCIDNFFNDKIARQTLVAQQHLLINRYKTYKTFGDYHQPYSMNVFGFIPPYTILINGQKLYFLQQIELIDTHKVSHETIRDNILNDLTYWRSELITADNLINKMIVAALVRNDLILLSELNLRYGVTVPKISELTASERSFELVTAAETEFVTYFEHDLQQAQDECDAEGKLMCIGKSIWYFLFYDHNDSVNMIAHSRNLELKQATLPLPELYRNKDVAPEFFSIGRWIRNSGGVFLTQESLGQFLPYVFRVNNLNLKIALLNATAHQPLGNTDPIWLKSILNPYGTNAGQAYVDKQGWLCFPVPIKDSNQIDGCIPWKVQNSS